MDPITLLMLGGTAVSLISGLVGTGMSMDASAREASANEAELKRSADLEQAKALDAIRQGQTAAARARMKTGMLRGAQAVGYAAAGVDSSTGTPAQVGLATEMVSELDAATIENNAVRAAFGFRETARGYQRQAANVRARGEAAQTAGILQGIGQVAGAVSQGASIYGRK